MNQVGPDRCAPIPIHVEVGLVISRATYHPGGTNPGNAMEIEGFEIDGIYAITPRLFEDDRGHFFEAWNAAEFSRATGQPGTFVQDNQSRSVAGVLRGLHYQVTPRAQGKLVRAIRGAVFDVAVDIRSSSPTFRRWVGIELTEKNRRQFWIPPGFAHGFYVLSDHADVLYKTTDYYAPDCDRAIRWNDPELAVDWPINSTPILSEKDEEAPLLSDADLFD